MRFAPGRRFLLHLLVLLVLLASLAASVPGQERSSTAVAETQQPPTAPWPVSGTLPPHVSARAAVVIDADSGAVLMDKNAHQPLPPASLTKILTALVALQNVDLKHRVVARFSLDELDPDGTAMGLRPGDELTIEDLLYGLMLPSGNDAALVLARAVAGNESAFVGMMNRAAGVNGLRATHFVNTHGLDAPGHLTSAYDIAQVARLAMRDPRFARIVGAGSWTVRGERTYTVYNRNPLLRSYRGADGVKTGWTEDAGSTIVASATRNGHRLLVALLDTDDRVGESAALLDWAFTGFRWPDDAIVSAPRR